LEGARHGERHGERRTASLLLFVVPELELVALIQVGNYSDGRTQNQFRDRTTRESILPAAALVSAGEYLLPRHSLSRFLVLQRQVPTVLRLLSPSASDRYLIVHSGQLV